MFSKKMFVLAGAVLALGAGVAHAEAAAGVDFKSAYVSKGATFNDGPVMQPWIEVYGMGLPEQYGSVTIGAWGNYDFGDYKDVAVSGSYQENDWYGEYSLPTLVDGLSLSIGYIEYCYAAGAYDRDVTLSAGYNLSGIDFGVTYYQGVGGGIDTRAYFAFDAGYGIEISDAMTASIDLHTGFSDGTANESGFQDYSIGAGISYVLTEQWTLGASVTYIGQGDSDVLPDATSDNVAGGYGYDVEFIGGVSLSCSL